MGKFSRILVALLASAAMAAPAFAIDGSFGGFLQTRAYTYDNVQDGSDATVDGRSGVDQRFRLYSTFAASEDVKAVFKIENDYVWGNSSDTNGLDENGPSSGNKEVGSLGSDAKGQIEIKNIYLDFNVAAINANVKLGTQYIKLGNGLINGDDLTAANIRMACPLVEGNSLNIVAVKVAEGFTATRNDAEYYHLQYDMKMGDMAVSPYVGYTDGAAGMTAFLVGADVKAKMGAIGLTATAFANSWDNDATNTDGTSIALYGKGSFTTGGTAVAVSAAYVGDEDNGGNALDVNGYHNYAEIFTGGKFDTRTGMAGQRTSAYSSNYMYLKLEGSQKYGATKITAALIHAQQAADAGAVKAGTLGQEVDLYVDYTITKGLTATAAAAYAMMDDDFGGDDAHKLGLAFTYKF